MASHLRLSDVDYSERIRAVFASRDIEAFKALAQRCLFATPSSEAPIGSHNRLLQQIMEHLFLLASAHPSRVDGLIDFVQEACAASEVGQKWQTDWGECQSGTWKLDAAVYSKMALRPAQGVLQMLFERLNPAYFVLGTQGISTPAEEFYDASERKASIFEVYGPTILLSRAFAKVPDLRSRLWRRLEDVLIISTMSGGPLAADEFVSLALIVDGAGRCVNQWTQEQSKGVGKNWVPWMGCLEFPFERWTFADAMQSYLSNTKGSPWMEAALTEDLLWVREETNKAAKAVISQVLPQEMGSKQLHDKYGWILEQLKDAPPRPAPMTRDEYLAKEAA